MSRWINAAGRGLRAEAAAQIDRWPLWIPVAFGAGAAAYFGLKSEPSLGVAGAIAALATAAALAARAWGRLRAATAAAALCAFAAAGFFDGGAATRLLAAPRAPADYGVGRIVGWVVDVSSPSAERGRMLIAPWFISHIPPERLPARIRVVTAPDQVIGPGAAVELTALLHPPPRPAAPGAFDFARDAYFDRIGAVGLALRPPTPVDLDRPGWPLALEMAVNRLRWSVAHRLADDIRRVAPWAGPGAAGLAAAVTTSHEAWLPPEDAEGLRGSGLAHMLAIAGLHTAAVSGFVFAALRLGVAAWPGLALRVSGKKVAAAGALLAVLGYLALSGGHPPARRAAITASVAFVAMLLDRRAVSLRSLALAALIVLLLQPEAVVQPGFQMSFSATGALVAMAEAWPRRAKPLAGPWPVLLLQKAKDGAVALFAVSFVAGAATGPFAIQHFNRMANYGVLANLTADFVASAVMMPALAVSLPVEAVGVGRDLLGPPLTVAAGAAEAVLAIGRVCAAAPGAQTTLSSAPPLAMLTAFLGILFGVLWKGRLRWIGAPLAFAVLLWPRPPPPLAWIAEDGANAAIVAAGRVVVLKPGLRPYAVSVWAARRGLRPPDPDAAVAQRDALFACDRQGCRPRPGTTPALGIWWSRRPPRDRSRLDALCRASDWVVIRAEVATPAACVGKPVVDAAALAAGGAGELEPEGDGVRLRWSEPIRGRRPWTAVLPSDSGG